MEIAEPRASPPKRVPRSMLVGWVTYDLANTIFSFNILTLYFPVWAVEQLGASDRQIGFALGTSMLLVAIASPLLGAASDRVGRRIPFLVASTLLCVTSTALLGIGGVPVVLTAYAVANFFFQLGLVFYDAMLPDVSTADDVGIVGGAGIGVGYMGSFIGLGAGIVLVDVLGYATRAVFVATAVLFLVFALPCFLFVREPRRARSRATVTDSLAQLRDTFRDVRARPNLTRFLVSRFIYADAANTTIAFMGIYATQEAGFDQSTVQPLLGAGIAAAIVGGFGFGRAVDRWGPKRVLFAVLALWCATLALAISVPVFGLPRSAFWFVAVGAGIGLGGTWASDRPLMLRLTPAGRVGEFYGVYGMVGRFAAVAGPFVWGLAVESLAPALGIPEFGRQLAVGLLLGMIVLAMVVLGPVDESEP